MPWDTTWFYWNQDRLHWIEFPSIDCILVDNVGKSDTFSKRLFKGLRAVSEKKALSRNCQTPGVPRQRRGIIIFIYTNLLGLLRAGITKTHCRVPVCQPFLQPFPTIESARLSSGSGWRCGPGFKTFGRNIHEPTFFKKSQIRNKWKSKRISGPPYSSSEAAKKPPSLWSWNNARLRQFQPVLPFRTEASRRAVWQPFSTVAPLSLFTTVIYMIPAWYSTSIVFRKKS